MREVEKEKLTPNSLTSGIRIKSKLHEYESRNRKHCMQLDRRETSYLISVIKVQLIAHWVKSKNK